MFDIHFQTNHAKNEFGCSYNGCEQNFKLKTWLKIHLNLVHPKSKPFKCEEFFAGNNLLLRHLYKKHNSFGFKCDLCQHYCKHNILLVKQLFRRVNQLVFKCGIDGREKSFKSNNYLRSHLYTNQMRFACDWPECGSGFRSEAGLKLDVQKRTGFKPFSSHWSQFKARFRTRKEFNSHKLRHIKPIECQVKGCGERFRIIHINRKHK